MLSEILKNAGAIHFVPKNSTKFVIFSMYEVRMNIEQISEYSPNMLKGAQVWDFGRVLKYFYIFTDGWDTGHYVFATACAVYASKLLPHAQHTPAKGYRMRIIR